MEYGILIAVAEDGQFQVVGAVSTRDEAHDLATEYLKIGPTNDYLAPWEFQIHRRSGRGSYTIIDHLRFA